MIDWIEIEKIPEEIKESCQEVLLWNGEYNIGSWYRFKEFPESKEKSFGWTKGALFCNGYDAGEDWISGVTHFALLDKPRNP